MRSTFAYLAFILISLDALAQTPLDALRLSRDGVYGTARFNAMGGAYSALGGDFSGGYLNPAGFGVYRQSEFSLTPAVSAGVSNSNYNGVSSLDSKNNFNFGSFSLVGAEEFKGPGKWRSMQYAAGVHRAYSYHQNYSVRGEGINSSRLDGYVSRLNNSGYNWTDLESESAPEYSYDVQLAWNTFLIDTLNGGNSFGQASGILPVGQFYRSQESGAKRETFLAISGNYDDKLYLGGGLNFSRIQYQRSGLYTESINPADSTTVLEEYVYDIDNTISGLGFSFKAGAIYRPIDNIRIGLALNSPTWYSLEDQYSTSMTATYGTDSAEFIYSSQSPNGFYEFRLRSPWKSTLGLAYIFGKLGLVSLDVDYVDYRSMRMTGISDGYTFAAENNEIRSAFASTFNYRVGAEYRVTPLFSLRGGYASYGNPFDANVADNGGFTNISFGGGYRNDTYSIDFSYQYRSMNRLVLLYNDTNLDPAGVDLTHHLISATFGYRF